eukprot:NODE_567_length_5957_cov_0.651588.p1 type:complete len:432 gc:universal NODE_567_length_5957_cov_0.651588:2564-1269(-)
MMTALKSILMIYLIFITNLYGVTVDCPVILNFLQGLNLHLTDPVLYQSIPADCCTTTISSSLGDLYMYCSGTAPNERLDGFRLTGGNVNGTMKSQFIPSALTYLEIVSTPLNTTIPSDLPNSILYLYLWYSKFQGTIPNTLPSQLIEFGASSNQLTGLPASLPNSITDLYLESGKFTQVPPLPASLNNLFMYDNLVTQFPKSFPSPSYILDFDLNQNLITGTIPNNLPNSIKYLYLSANVLQGAIPNSLPSKLFDLDLSENQLSVLPTSFPVGTQRISIGGNLFTTLPSFPPNIQQMNISDNLIYDKLPNTFPATLKNFQAARNKIYGSIPTLNSAMTTLDLSNNQLNGTIPNLPNSLLTLNLNNNLLTGILPTSWPAGLTDLLIGHNKLTGDLASLNLTNSITKLDLSWNSFSGNLQKFKPLVYSLVDVS